jgi:hypothetical protein
MNGLETRRCTATNRAGERCGRAPIPGGFVCLLHGGGAPAVQQSAKARLLAGADLAIDYLLNLLTPKPPCERCGRSDADRDPVVVRACQLVLDRSGFHPTLTVEQAPPRNEYADLTEDELIERLEKLLESTRARRDFHREHSFARLFPNPAAIDAVVDDGYLVPEDDAEPVAISGASPLIHELDVQKPSGNGTHESCTTADEDVK